MLEFNGPKCYGKQIYGVTAYGEWKPLKGKSLEIWRQHQIGTLAPYGQFQCDDGSEIIFSRGYEAIYQRDRGSQPIRRLGCRTIKGWCAPPARIDWQARIYFYDHQTSDARRLIVSKTKLIEWGVLDDFNEYVAQLSDAQLETIITSGRAFRWK